MPAYFDTGFSVRQPMWHGLGNVLQDAPETWDEARLAAGLMWEPRKDALYRIVTVPAAADLPGNVVQVLGVDADSGAREVLVKVEEFRAVVRDDTQAALAVVREEFPLISHATMGDLMDVIAKEAGSTFRYETAGSIQGGRKVWSLAYLDEPFTVPGDDSATYPFFALTNAHDGEGACRVIPTNVRIVCWNTYQAANAEADRHGFEVVIRHAGDVGQRIEDAKQALRAARSAAVAWREEATLLSGLRYDDGILRTYLEEFIPTPENATPELLATRDERRALCRKLLAESPTLAPLPDTAYKLVSLSGEYLDHIRSTTSPDGYLKRTMLAPRGRGGNVAVKAHFIERAKVLCSAN